MTEDLNDDNETSEEKDLFAEVNYLKIAMEHLNDRFDSIADRLTDIKKPLDLEQRAARAIEVLDKFDNYMRNLEKSNIMINELKGQVALVRSAIRAMQDEKFNINKRYKAALKGLFAGLKDSDSDDNI